jgi:hypothetical protein
MKDAERVAKQPQRTTASLYKLRRNQGLEARLGALQWSVWLDNPTHAPLKPDAAWLPRGLAAATAPGCLPPAAALRAGAPAAPAAGAGTAVVRSTSDSTEPPKALSSASNLQGSRRRQAVDLCAGGQR